MAGKSQRYYIGILIAILLVAGFLRLYRLTQHDVITDEVFYGYRSIGLVDSLNSPYQGKQHAFAAGHGKPSRRPD